MKTIPNGVFNVILKVMQVANTGFLVKTNVAVSSAIRNTSCSRGWLRLVVQTIFGLITVASFIMIMILALQRDPNGDSNVGGSRRCSTSSSCRVVCSETPSYEDFVNDIIATLMYVENHCENGISLQLHRPRFINSTIPRNWMSQVRSKVTELNIVGGNLVCIEQDAFMSSFASNINHLGLVEISLGHVSPNDFVGLSSLQVLDIRDSDIGYIHRNALRPVADTLRELNIRNSKYWNPANLTGTSELNSLVKVDFSSNTFYSVLDRESFRQLEHCEELRLSSSRIISIGTAAFDFMVRIQRIYMNNNFLVSLPANIFDRVTALAFPRPSIDLQDNLWRCDCYNDHLRKLQAENYLMVDPTCRTPYELNGRAFSSFKSFCCENHLCIWNRDNNTLMGEFEIEKTNVTNDLFLEDPKGRNFDSLYIDGACKSSSSNYGLAHDYKCLTNRARYLNYTTLFTVSKQARSSNDRLIPTFFVETSVTSLLELRTYNFTGYDLVWFQTDCLSDIFCVNTVPEFLRIYNVNKNSTYTFCTVDKREGRLIANNCLTYSYSRIPRFPNSSTPMRVVYVYVLIYVSTIAVSAVLGGICLYALIRRNPALLKGSKRILLVKHKAVDALVLPPRVPYRISRDNSWGSSKDSVVTRRHSTTSGKSNSPSYISALQPTEAQLAEWRLKRHFSNDMSVSTNQYVSSPIESNLVSYIYDGDSLYYPLDKTHNVEITTIRSH